jgi:IS5 family transposase
MLRDRYEHMNIFELIPALSSAMEPVLTQLDHLLEDDPLFQKVKADMAKRYPQTLVNGRPSTPVEVILRMLVVKHLYNWSYEETEHWVADSLVLRQFCRVYSHPVPDDTTLNRWALLIQPATLHTLLDHVSKLAQQLKVTRGRKLRVDSTVVQTNIRYPTDSRLLADGVRVISRLLKRSRTVLGEAASTEHDAFRSRTRSAQRHLQRIYTAVRQRGEEAGERVSRGYRDLVRVTQASLA